MSQGRLRVLSIVILAILLLTPTGIVFAEDHLPPVPQIGPRLSPSAIPHTGVLNPDTIYNNLLTPPPVQSLEANAADGGRSQEKPGRGIRQTITPHSVGITLFAAGTTCNDFNRSGNWAVPPSDIHTDWYAGWAPFAVNEGLYQAKNTVFAMERVVGPGKNYGNNQFSAKISSNQPYAGGYGSPMIAVTPGADVTVSAKYLIWDHDHKGLDYDWASMGIKPDAVGEEAIYVNGYVRGEWAELHHTVTAGASGKIMVLLQGSSPMATNSNIYFDDVQIAVDGKFLRDCRYE
ncbi:MAG: hypothetical protein KDE31_38700 [Caldilineaceae bacterium]|nr:hypothetical protein [Caldilineaceae bacterium]